MAVTAHCWRPRGHASRDEYVGLPNVYGRRGPHAGPRQLAGAVAAGTSGHPDVCRLIAGLWRSVPALVRAVPAAISVVLHGCRSSQSADGAGPVPHHPRTVLLHWRLAVGL